MNARFLKYTVFFLVVVVLNYGCHSYTKTQKGASIGAGAGGVIGAFIGKSAGNTALGAIIGAAVGGTAGAFVGRTMDGQANELKKSMPGATVERHGDGILIKFDHGVLFDPGKANLLPDALTNLQNLATSLQKHPETNVTIVGNTDNKEAGRLSMALSVQRADSVRTFLTNNHIDESRLTVQGKGATQPLADNNTPEGRTKNRRVEVIISASNKLLKEAHHAVEE